MMGCFFAEWIQKPARFHTELEIKLQTKHVSFRILKFKIKRFAQELMNLNSAAGVCGFRLHLRHGKSFYLPRTSSICQKCVRENRQLAGAGAVSLHHLASRRFAWH